jgi:hypothetical protein
MRTLLLAATAALMLTETTGAAARLTDADYDLIHQTALLMVYYRHCEPQPKFSWQSNMPANVKNMIDKIKIIYGDANVAATYVFVEAKILNSPENPAKWCAESKPIIEHGIKTL